MKRTPPIKIFWEAVQLLFNSVLKKSLFNWLFKNSKCKEQKKFKIAAYL